MAEIRFNGPPVIIEPVTTAPSTPVASRMPITPPAEDGFDNPTAPTPLDPAAPAKGSKVPAPVQAAFKRLRKIGLKAQAAAVNVATRTVEASTGLAAKIQEAVQGAITSIKQRMRA